MTADELTGANTSVKHAPANRRCSDLSLHASSALNRTVSNVKGGGVFDKCVLFLKLQITEIPVSLLAS